MDIGQTPEKAQREGKTRSSGIEKEVRAMGMQQNGPTQDVQTSVFITASRAASPALDPRWEWPWRRDSVWCARFLSLRVRTMTMWSLLTSCPNKCWGRRSPPPEPFNRPSRIRTAAAAVVGEEPPLGWTCLSYRPVYHNFDAQLLVVSTLSSPGF